MCEHSPQRVSSKVNRCSNLQHSGGTTPLTGLAAPLPSALSWESESGIDRPWGGLRCTPLKRKQPFSRKRVHFQNVFNRQISIARFLKKYLTLQWDICHNIYYIMNSSSKHNDKESHCLLKKKKKKSFFALCNRQWDMWTKEVWWVFEMPICTSTNVAL